MKKWIFLGIGLVVGIGIGTIGTRNHYRKLAFDEINEARDVFRKMASSKEAVNRNAEMKQKMMTDIPESEEKSGSDEDKTGKTGTKAHFS